MTLKQILLLALALTALAMVVRIFEVLPYRRDRRVWTSSKRKKRTGRVRSGRRGTSNKTQRRRPSPPRPAFEPDSLKRLKGKTVAQAETMMPNTLFLVVKEDGEGRYVRCIGGAIDLVIVKSKITSARG